jgi:nucleotide-binding universal stress UspA family protein
VNTEICEGQLAEVMLARAIDLSIDLIIIDAKRFKELSKFQPDQMAHKLAHHASYASLLVVRPSAQIRPLNTILVIDDSLEAWRAVEFMCALSLPQWARVTVITIAQAEEALSVASGLINHPPLAGQRHKVIGSPDLFIVQVIERLHNCGTQVWSSFRLKDSADEILTTAQAHAGDLIVIGAHHQSHDQPFKLDGLVQDIAKYAPCSVLVVR